MPPCKGAHLIESASAMEIVLPRKVFLLSATDCSR